MNRVIKFRAKQLHSPHWCYGAFIPASLSSWADDTIFDGNFRKVIDTDTLGQYTGLCDSEENEIYEGDVLDFAVFDYQGCDTQYRGVVVFANAEWELWPNPNDEYWGNDGAFNLAWVLSQYDETKVLGNIFDNPELLGGDKK